MFFLQFPQSWYGFSFIFANGTYLTHLFLTWSCSWVAAQRWSSWRRSIPVTRIWSSTLLELALLVGKWPEILGSSGTHCKNLSRLDFITSADVLAGRFLRHWGRELNILGALLVKLWWRRVAALEDWDLTEGYVRTFPRLGDHLKEIPGFGTLPWIILYI